MMTNNFTTINELEGIRIGDNIENGKGISGKVILINIDRYKTETHFYFSLDKGKQTILVIK